MTGATVFRRNGPAWRFELDAGTGWLIHLSRPGTKVETMYRLGMFIHAEPPIRIARSTVDGWEECTARIGAYLIQFDGAGEYWFQQGERQ